MEKEGGLELLQDVIEHELPPEPVKMLAMIVLEICREYKENPWNEALLDG